MLFLNDTHQYNKHHIYLSKCIRLQYGIMQNNSFHVIHNFTPNSKLPSLKSGIIHNIHNI